MNLKGWISFLVSMLSPTCLIVIYAEAALINVEKGQCFAGHLYSLSAQNRVNVDFEIIVSNVNTKDQPYVV